MSTPPDERGVYLAGPLGFSEAGRLFHAQVLVPQIAALGATVLDPWNAPFSDMVAAQAMAPGPDRTRALAAANGRHGRHNADLLDACAVVFAVLDGPDVDSGTAAEIGYAAAIGKPVVAWRGDLRQSGDNEACLVNLQVEQFVVASGGVVCTDLQAAMGELESRLPRA